MAATETNEPKVADLEEMGLSRNQAWQAFTVFFHWPCQSYSIDLERGGESSPPWLKVLGELARLAEVTLPFNLMADDQ